MGRKRRGASRAARIAARAHGAAIMVAGQTSSSKSSGASRWWSCCLESVHRDAAPIFADLRRRASSKLSIGRESAHNAEQRGLTVHEIVSTEQAYLVDLRLLTKVYKPALAAAVSGAAADFRGQRDAARPGSSNRRAPLHDPLCHRLRLSIRRLKLYVMQVSPGVFNSIFHPSLEPLVELHTELLGSPAKLVVLVELTRSRMACIIGTRVERGALFPRSESRSLCSVDCTAFDHLRLVRLEAAEADANAASAAAAVGKALGTIVPYLRLYAGYCADYTQTVQAGCSPTLCSRSCIRAAVQGCG